MKKRNPLNLPTERIELPSKGKVYPKESPLALGYVEMTYPTAKEEDIITNPNYLTAGTAIDKFIESILVTDIDLLDLIPTDKDALMLAARILGLGAEYTDTESYKQPVTFNLSDIKEKEVNWDLFDNTNEFSYELSGAKIKFKIPTCRDIEAMSKEVEGLKKINPDAELDTTLRYKFTITEVNGARDSKTIRDFSDRIRMADSRKLKTYMDSVTPGYIWKGTGTYIKDNKQEKVEDLSILITLTFFWPQS